MARREPTIPPGRAGSTTPGPQSSVLPPVGLLLGAAVGARPEEVLLDGGLGSVLGAAGICYGNDYRHSR